MSLESIIQTHGYWVLLFGTFLEGETILVLGGFLAHRGYLDLQWVIAAACIGTLAGDQMFFFIGRIKGSSFLDKKPLWKPGIEKVHKLLERYQLLLILGFRFLYGLRTVTPFVIGMSRVKTERFVILNIIGALIWAVVIGTGGYLFGTVFEAFLGDIRHIETYLIIAIPMIGLLIWTVHFIREKVKMGSGTEEI